MGFYCLNYQDELIKVETGVDINGAAKGNSQEDLSDGIKITIFSANSHMIQFKSKLAKWLDGPGKGGFDSDIPEFSKGLNALEWYVDVFDEDKPNPYYDESAESQVVDGHKVILDQPDISFVQNLYWDSKTDTPGGTFPIKNIFCAASIIIIDNRVRRVVAWTRTGGVGDPYYKVKVETINSLSQTWRTVLLTRGFNVPAVS
ncbi:hypothetical protein BSG18_07840 [Pseudomonas ogarae]|uniref:hypothetical protein n=1 Tax=Pseudomonas ogarae (strain DSM 112162 / CECT 30235 / F113) TaxID=1114970 RepID=UPI001142C78E|nr:MULTISPECIES: hypothetical protein [Pseudomonas]PBJ25741.1 hypothetical protein BSG18_07840 [Pseudomonas ogarae]QXH93157.1 hypothetical protein HU749_020125 [Pseudomonas zarinae]